MSKALELLETILHSSCYDEYPEEYGISEIEYDEMTEQLRAEIKAMEQTIENMKALPGEKIEAVAIGTSTTYPPQPSAPSDSEILTFRRLQDEQRPWVAHNFPGRDKYYPLLGAMEELGELSHAHLKALQGIRTNENHEEKKADAVADIIIFLADYCAANDIDLQETMEKTWAQIKQRDWKKDPANGGSAIAEAMRTNS